MKSLSIAVGVALVLSHSLARPAQAAAFFADPAIQAQAPAAFALQPESLPFLKELADSAPAEREAFLELLSGDPALVAAIASYGTLPWAEQEAVLRAVFALEVKSLGITAPELVIAPGATAGPAFFDFDPANPGPGRVILNPDALAKQKNPLAGLMLLIHETRHSAQFQLAYSGSGTALAHGYREAFVAQKSLTGKLGFCDFLTLNNELEAFQFGNYIVGALTDWTADTLGMGTYASQFLAGGAPRLDLLELFEVTPPGKVLDAFNELEKDQFEKLNP
jgi:hypothetical protein